VTEDTALRLARGLLSNWPASPGPSPANCASGRIFVLPVFRAAGEMSVEYDRGFYRGYGRTMQVTARQQCVGSRNRDAGRTERSGCADMIEICGFPGPADVVCSNTRLAAATVVRRNLISFPIPDSWCKFRDYTRQLFFSQGCIDAVSRLFHRNPMGHQSSAIVHATVGVAFAPPGLGSVDWSYLRLLIEDMDGLVLHDFCFCFQEDSDASDVVRVCRTFIRLVKQAICLFKPTDQIILGEHSNAGFSDAGLWDWNIVSQEILPLVGGVKEVILDPAKASNQDIAAIWAAIIDPANTFIRVVLCSHPGLFCPFCVLLMTFGWRIRHLLGDWLIVDDEDVWEWTATDDMYDWWTEVCEVLRGKFRMHYNHAEILVPRAEVDYVIAIPRSEDLYRLDCTYERILYEAKAEPLNLEGLFVEISSLQHLTDFVCTVSCIGAMMQMYAELLGKYLVFDKFLVVHQHDRDRSDAILQVYGLIRTGMGKDLLELSKYIGLMHHQARRILSFRGQEFAGQIPNSGWGNSMTTGDYDIFKLGADLRLDLDFLHHHVYHVEPSDLTRVGRSRNWPHDPWS
jgi:hypothetical protein